MADWILKYRKFSAVLFAMYFVTHIAIRVSDDRGLSFDESEQVFLSQWMRWGYNSQPPLYTWIQSLFFSIFGYRVLALSLLKNSLIGLTYVVVFRLVHRTTGDSRKAIAGSLGMLMIPQIAWESHRDLSHTVLVTFATAWLIDRVIATMQSRTTWNYAAIGIVSALGMMSKYNFAVVVLAVIVSAMTIPRYRQCLLDRRLVLSLVVAIALFAPHLVWVIQHQHLASAKTIGTLTADQTLFYFDNLAVGSKALLGSITSCVLLAVVVFAIAYRERFIGRANGSVAVSPSEGLHDATTQLIGRFLMASFVILALLVLSGNGLEFKNRWIQPFVCLLPTYFVLRWGVAGGQVRSFDERLSLNRIALMGVLAMVAVITGALIRHARTSGSRVAEMTAEQRMDRTIDGVILTPIVSLAGDLKLKYPDHMVLANDHPHLGSRWRRSQDEPATPAARFPEKLHAEKLPSVSMRR
ncbi:glycosyltransferase family 39 protein [Neorhodopirellula pilleata]|uniref:Glycosyltransferase RgtA/B/C/D-like domain-containing protein n=1 Tax=Neorhodopirellula pilleata TaxID=2714738 RepID=A0A5C6A6K9_9BACT|nr:glycosyltransferase family 39 protein [Neorhodopirellula pilleata]TWT95612.1 hypothetical protein Pla100_32530 [Neorhodopirellula pilleata]